MRMVAPRTGAAEVTIAEEQEEYLPLTVGLYMDENGVKYLLSRWKPTDEERAKLLAGEDVFVMLMTFGHPMQPIQVRVGPGDWTVPE